MFAGCVLVGSAKPRQASTSGWRHPASDTPLPGEYEASTPPPLSAHSPLPTPTRQVPSQDNISPLVQRYDLQLDVTKAFFLLHHQNHAVDDQQFGCDCNMACFAFKTSLACTAPASQVQCVIVVPLRAIPRNHWPAGLQSLCECNTIQGSSSMQLAPLSPLADMPGPVWDYESILEDYMSGVNAQGRVSDITCPVLQGLHP